MFAIEFKRFDSLFPFTVGDEFTAVVPWTLLPLMLAPKILATPAGNGIELAADDDDDVDDITAAATAEVAVAGPVPVPTLPPIFKLL